jgi:hypothetical protein
MREISYEEATSRSYLILLLRKKIKAWKEEWDMEKYGWGRQFEKGKSRGKYEAALELEKLLSEIPLEL